MTASERKRRRPSEAWRSMSRSEDSLVPTFGVACLLGFCLVIISQRLPLGEVTVVGALLAVFARQEPLRFPGFLLCYLAYLVLGAIGLPFTDFPSVVAKEIGQVVKYTLIAFCLCNLLTTRRDCRTFILGYLAIFTLFPIRGSMQNYILDITVFGRVAWNFIFSNPNDLAMLCFLPMGLCGYLFFTEKGWLRLGTAALFMLLLLVILLTQSRGAMLGLFGALLWFIGKQKRKFATAAIVLFALAGVAAFAPSGVWERVAGLKNVDVRDMSRVDAEGSAPERWTIMGIGVNIAAENPVLGVGIGAYTLAHARATAARVDLARFARGYRDAHSSYIRPAAETGFLGAIFIVACMLLSFRHTTRARGALTSSGLHSKALAILALQCSLIAFAIGAFFNSAERSTFFMLQFAVPWALSDFALKSLVPKSTANASKKHSQLRARPRIDRITGRTS